MADVIVSEGHNSGTIQVKAGNSIVVQLPETPTTGFRWAVSASDPHLLALTGDDFQLTSAGTGGGGLRIFRFLARGEGNADLELRLVRSWDSGAPKSVFHVRVNIVSS